MGRDGRVPQKLQMQAPLFAELPPEGMIRWVPRRKAQVVHAVRGGVLSLDDACRRYALTVEEFLTWQRAVDRSSTPGPAIGQDAGWAGPAFAKLRRGEQDRP